MIMGEYYSPISWCQLQLETKFKRPVYSLLHVQLTLKLLFSLIGFSLDSRPGYWWTVVWIACGLGAIGMAVLILRFIEEVIV